jgi:hypothetical protein
VTTRFALALAAISALILPDPAAATTSSFATEPASPAAQGTLVCRLVNDAADARRVRVRAIDALGRSTFDSGLFRLAAGASWISGAGVGARRCLFTVEGDVVGLHGHGLLLSPDEGAVSLPPRAVR